MKTKTQAERTGSPAAEQTNEERTGRRRRYWQSIWHVVSVLITVAAAAVLVSTLLFPVFRIYGTSMTPALEAGDVVVAVRPTGSLKQGDLIAFYFNNKILIKRVIAKSGDWIDIDSDGNVYVNDKMLSEPYLAANEKSLGTCTIDLPYQVPDGRIFVMGDHRAVSLDSRDADIGCVADEQIAGKLIFRIWPFTRIGAAG
ncbi:MAG: signal peptidase I [Eubacteriales bacterium]|jgi:signal peptidase I